ncbi:hypothetical protein JCM37172_11090 [Faecalimonas hominis]
MDNWIFKYHEAIKKKVIKRTAKTVVVLKDGEEKRCKIGLSWNGKEETITPWGVYSMCPVIGASDIAA